MADFFSNLSLVEKVLLVLPGILILRLILPIFFNSILIIFSRIWNKNLSEQPYFSRLSKALFSRLLNIAMLGTTVVWISIFLLNLDEGLFHLIGAFLCVVGYQIVFWSVGIRSEFLANDV